MLIVFLIICFLYVLVGLLMFRFQERWYEKNNPSFFNGISPFDYVRFVFRVVFLWLPNLIVDKKFKKADNKKKKYNKT